MVVHPGAANKSGTLVNALLFHFPEIGKIGPPERPGIVHRLDKDTSGVLVVARTKIAYSWLQNKFKAREVEKHYLGLVRGRILHKQGKLTWPIGRHAREGNRMSIKTKKPRAAETHYQVKEIFNDFSFLEIKPITGRMHQIRVHLASAGHPIAGDTIYGRQKIKDVCPRLFLHAGYMAFTHPTTKIRMEFRSPLPPDLCFFLDKIRK